MLASFKVTTRRRQSVRPTGALLLLLTSCAGSSLARNPEAAGMAVSADARPLRVEWMTAHPDELILDEHGIPLFKDAFTGPPTDVVGLPGEYESVERVLLGWHAGNWGYLDFFASVLRAVTPDAVAVIAVEDAEDEALLRDALASRGVDQERLQIVVEPLDSMWIRDYGPVLVRTQRGFRVIDFPYHTDRENDDRYPTYFAAREHLPVSRPALEMEGGHIQSDGVGRCIVTDDVLGRNEGFLYQASDVRRLLSEFLGCRDVVFVPPLFAEETGHVDVFSYVTGPSRVIVGRYVPTEDPVNARRLDMAAHLLTDAGWQVTRIHMPRNDRRHVFRTYTNALVTNHTVMVPVFRRDRRFEAEALRAFREAFPGRRVVGVPADSVMGLAGAIHCTVIAVPALGVHPWAAAPPPHG